MRWTLAKFKQSRSWFDQTAAQPWWGSRIPNGSAGWWAKWDNSFWSSLLGEVSDVFLWFFSISNFKNLAQRVALQVSEWHPTLRQAYRGVPFTGCHRKPQAAVQNLRVWQSTVHGGGPSEKTMWRPGTKKVEARNRKQSSANRCGRNAKATGSNWEKIEFLTVGKNITGKPS